MNLKNTDLEVVRGKRRRELKNELQELRFEVYLLFPSFWGPTVALPILPLGQLCSATLEPLDSHDKSPIHRPGQWERANLVLFVFLTLCLLIYL